jgi:hypothetical protein
MVHRSPRLFVPFVILFNLDLAAIKLAGVTSRVINVRGWILMLLFGSLFVPLSGCRRGEELGEVFGRVTADGQPVHPAAVLFTNPTMGVNMTAITDEQGSYRVVMAKGVGLPLGDYQVIVGPPPADQAMGPAGRAPGGSQSPSTIPERYQQLSTTPLSLTVKSGKNQFDIELSE